MHARQCSCGATEMTVLRGSDRLVFKAKALKALRGESALHTEVLSFLDMIHRSLLHELLATVQMPTGRTFMWRWQRCRRRRNLE